MAKYIAPKGVQAKPLKIPKYATPSQTAKMNRNNKIWSPEGLNFYNNVTNYGGKAAAEMRKKAPDAGKIYMGNQLVHKSKKVVMSKGEVVKEHKHLVKVLKSGKGLKKEAKKQGKELAKYKKHKVCKKYGKNSKKL